MQLGINAVHALDTWSAFRPTNDQGMQAGPPFSGDWNARVYPDTLIPGTMYRCILNDAGRLRGDYAFNVKANSFANLQVTLRGDVIYNGSNRATFGSGNAWMELTVAHELKVAELFVNIYNASRGAPPTFLWKDEFLAAMAPFNACYRAMDLCGVGSRIATTMAAEDFGGFAQRPLNWNDMSPWGMFAAETGCNPKLWFPPDIKRAWINIPPMIAAHPSERVKWIYEAHRHSMHVGQVICGIGNEVWDNDKAIGQLLLSVGSDLGGGDRSVGRCLALLRLTSALQDDLKAMRLENWMPIFEWQIGDMWPWSFNQWSRRWVSDEARRLLVKIGNVAIAPYGGRGITSLDQLPASIDEERIYVQAWQALLLELGLTRDNLHAYEMSHLHFPRNHPESWLRDPKTIDATDQFMAAMNEDFGENSVCNIYGLCEAGQFGVLQRLEDWGHDQLYARFARYGK